MATYYVRASNDLPALGGGNPKHMPHPGYKYEAADADDAVTQHLAAFPALLAVSGIKFAIFPDSAIEWRTVTPSIQPTTPVTYT